MVKAIFFDFWGTIVENGVVPSPVRQVKYILRLQRMPFGEFIKKFEESFMLDEYGNLTDAFNNVIKEFDLNPPGFVVEKLVGMWNKNMLLAKPFPDTVATLKKLKKDYKLVLISNTDQFSVEPVIEKYKLADYFDEMIFSYKEKSLKTDPELFKIALKKIKAKPEDVIMVGDSMESDIEGAAKAGIKGILIDRRDKREYEPKIMSLSEIEKHIDEK